MKNPFSGFKEFAFKGNLIDMATGFIIGGAFSTVVKSLVDNVFMPPLGKLSGEVNFSDKFIALNGQHYDTYAAAKQQGAPVMGYGQFLTDFISFLILAFAVFLIVKKFAGMFQRHEEARKAAPPEPSAEEKLLTEIRDLLKAKS